jgi:hypothetical protein
MDAQVLSDFHCDILFYTGPTSLVYTHSWKVLSLEMQLYVTVTSFQHSKDIVSLFSAFPIASSS